MTTTTFASAPSAGADLSEEGLLALAAERTGLSDFGEDGFREGLRALLAMYTTTARLTPEGRKATQRRLVELLANRTLVARAFQEHPEIRGRAVRSPMYLTGLPRTGTSALFNVLGADPSSRPLLYWEGKHPDPLRPPAAGGEDPRLSALREAIARAQKKNPEFTKIHEVHADAPEECIQLLAHTLGGVQMGIEPLLSPYREWFERQDLRAPYAYYADLLRLVDWQRPGKRWLLKSPAHLWALDVLVEMFPDACIIQTHRDPIPVVASYCSMMFAMMRGREGVDRLELGPTVLEYLARSAERGMAARDRSDPRRFVDVRYRDFVKDPLGTVAEIYDVFRLELTPAAEKAMRGHVESHPQNKHGTHDYSLEEFGLTPERVRKRLAGYIERFELA
ncbi:MAG TPA: sulfotransferase [Polyangiaceae bacterium]|jgi:hypothetical protein